MPSTASDSLLVRKSNNNKNHNPNSNWFFKKNHSRHKNNCNTNHLPIDIMHLPVETMMAPEASMHWLFQEAARRCCVELNLKP